MNLFTFLYRIRKSNEIHFMMDKIKSQKFYKKLVFKTPFKAIECRTPTLYMWSRNWNWGQL